MTKTRITAIVTVQKKVVLDIDYSINPNNLRQMDTLRDELDIKFYLAPNVLKRDYDIIEFLPINCIELDKVSEQHS